PYLSGNAPAQRHRHLPCGHRRGDLRRDLAAEGAELPDRQLRVGHRGVRLPRARLHPRREGQEAFHRPQDQFGAGLPGAAHPPEVRDVRRQRVPGEHVPHQDAHQGLRSRHLSVRVARRRSLVQGASAHRVAAAPRDRGTVPRPQPDVTKNPPKGGFFVLSASKIHKFLLPSGEGCAQRRMRVHATRGVALLSHTCSSQPHLSLVWPSNRPKNSSCRRRVTRPALPVPTCLPSTERICVISAAVPHISTSSARYRYSRGMSRSTTSMPSSRASVFRVSRVMPARIDALAGVVCSTPSNTRNRFSPAPSLSRPLDDSAMPSPKPRRRASRAISWPER